MLKLHRQIPVRASREVLWEMLKDLARKPLRYMSLPTSASVTHHPDGGFVSRIDASGFHVQERVRFDEKTRSVTYELDRNGDWAGSRELRVDSDPMNSQGGRLEILWDWTPLSEKARHLDPFGFVSFIEDMLVLLKAFAEDKASTLEFGARRASA